MQCFHEIVVEGKTSNLYIDKKSFKVEYGHDDIKRQNRDVVKQGYFAS